MLYHTLNLLGRYAAAYSKKRLKDAGLSSTEHLLCCLLFGHGPLCQDDMAARLLMDKTTLAKALAELERSGLVSRAPDPENRRKNLVALTEAGREAISPALDVYDRWSAEVTAELTPREAAGLEAVSRKLLARAAQISAEV